MNGRLFATDGNKFLKAVPDGDTGIKVHDVGISPPLNAPEIRQIRSEGALMPGVEYSYAYTYYNSKEDVESNPSPISNKVEINKRQEGKFTRNATSENLGTPVVSGVGGGGGGGGGGGVYNAIVTVYINQDFAEVDSLIGKYIFFSLDITSTSYGTYGSNSDKDILFSRKISSISYLKSSNEIALSIQTTTEDDVYINKDQITSSKEYYIEDGDYEIGYITDQDLTEVKVANKHNNKKWIHLGNVGSDDYFGRKITLYSKTFNDDVKEDTYKDTISNKRNSESRWIIDYDMSSKMALLSAPLKKKPFVGQMYMVEKILSDDDIILDLNVVKRVKKQKSNKRAIIIGDRNEYDSVFLKTIPPTNSNKELTDGNLTDDFMVRIITKDSNGKNKSGLYEVRGYIPSIKQDKYWTNGNDFASDDKSFCAITLYDGDFKGKIVGLYSTNETRASIYSDTGSPDGNPIEEVTHVTIIKKNAIENYNNELKEYAIKVSNINKSDDTEADKIRIYRASNNGINYSLCAEIDNAEGSEYTDGIADEYLGDQVEFDNTKPIVPEIIETYKDRMIYSGSKLDQIMVDGVKNDIVLLTKDNIENTQGSNIINIINQNRTYGVDNILSTKDRKGVIRIKSTNTTPCKIIIPNSQSFAATRSFIISTKFRFNCDKNRTAVPELNFHIATLMDENNYIDFSLDLLYRAGVEQYFQCKIMINESSMKTLQVTLPPEIDGIEGKWCSVVYTSEFINDKYKHTMVCIVDGVEYSNSIILEEYMRINYDNHIKLFEYDADFINDSLDFVSFSFTNYGNSSPSISLLPIISGDTGLTITDISNNGNTGNIYTQDGEPEYLDDYYSQYKFIIKTIYLLAESCINESAVITRPVQEIRYSKINSPDSSPSIFYILTGKNDGLPVTCLHVHKGRLFVFKNNSFSTLQFLDNSDMITESDSFHGIGCVGKKAICDNGKYMYWMSRNGVYRYTIGGDMVNISMPVKNWWTNGNTFTPDKPNTFSRIDISKIHLTRAIYDKERNIAIFLVNPDDNGAYPHAIVFDQTKTDNDSKFTWYVWEFANYNVTSILSTDEEIVDSIDNKSGRVLMVTDAGATNPPDSEPTDLIYGLSVLDNIEKDVDNIGYDWIITFAETNLGTPLTVKRWHYFNIVHVPNLRGGEYNLEYKNDYYGVGNKDGSGWVLSAGKLDSKLLNDRAPIPCRGTVCNVMLSGRVPVEISSFGYELKPKGDLTRNYK